MFKPRINSEDQAQQGVTLSSSEDSDQTVRMRRLI